MAKRKQEEEPKESLVDLVRVLAEERDIDAEEVFQAIESGIVAAYKREFGSNNKDAKIKNVFAEIDRDTGEIYVYKLAEVVDEVLDPLNEISLNEAQDAGGEDIEIGDEIEVAIDVEDLGRLAAGAAVRLRPADRRIRPGPKRLHQLMKFQVSPAQPSYCSNCCG